jgi:hypothetical protein
MSDTSSPASSVEPFAATAAVDPSALHIPGSDRIELQAVSAGTIVSRTAEVMGANLVKVLGVTALVHLPNLLFMMYLLHAPIIVEPERVKLVVSEIASLRMLLSLVLAGIAAAPVTYIVVQHLRGVPTSLGEAIGQGLRRLVPSAITSVLVTLLGTLATFVLIVPGIIVFSMLYVAVPVVVIERVGIFGSLSRSSTLTRGYKGSIFGFFILLVAAMMLVGFVLRLVHLNGETTDVGVIGSWIVGVVFGAASAVATAVTYHDLRVSKDGVQTDELARVFD